jgi:predicted small lipoprotein YifL
MRTRTTITAIAAIATLALTGCGPEPEFSTTPDAKATAADTKAPAAKATKEAPNHETAVVGDSLTQKGNSDGEQLSVTLKKWVDPAKSADEFMKPAQGKRWVAVQFELLNTGSAIYDDSPSNGVQVADVDGQRFSATFGEVTAGPSMASGVKLPKGEKALGWIVVEVPKASKIASVQFTMNSGFSNQTGQWSVK